MNTRKLANKRMNERADERTKKKLLTNDIHSIWTTFRLSHVLQFIYLFCFFFCFVSTVVAVVVVVACTIQCHYKIILFVNERYKIRAYLFSMRIKTNRIMSIKLFYWIQIYHKIFHSHKTIRRTHTHTQHNTFRLMLKQNRIRSSYYEQIRRKKKRVWCWWLRALIITAVNGW